MPHIYKQNLCSNKIVKPTKYDKNSSKKETKILLNLLMQINT
jgi:hypothetical protein